MARPGGMSLIVPTGRHFFEMLCPTAADYLFRLKVIVGVQPIRRFGGRNGRLQQDVGLVLDRVRGYGNNGLATLRSQNKYALTGLCHPVSRRVGHKFCNHEALFNRGVLEGIENRAVAWMLYAWNILEEETVGLRLRNEFAKTREPSLDGGPALPRSGGQDD